MPKLIEFNRSASNKVFYFGLEIDFFGYLEATRLGTCMFNQAIFSSHSTRYGNWLLCSKKFMLFGCRFRRGRQLKSEALKTPFSLFIEVFMLDIKRANENPRRVWRAIVYAAWLGELEMHRSNFINSSLHSLCHFYFQSFQSDACHENAMKF